MGLRNYIRLGKCRPPEVIAFEHLQSEYLTLKSRINDDEAKSLIDKLIEKKDGKLISWNELYFFELTLAQHLPVEKLRSKVMRLRYDYRNVAGQKEFDDYMAAKPPDLQSPPQPADPPHATEAHYEKLLREDLKDLLGRMYLEYAILPVRERRLTILTWYAAGLCLAALVVLMGILAALYILPLLSEMDPNKSLGVQLFALRNSEKLSAITIFVVVIAGAMGGFVSALQRIQTPSTEGDSLYNLSLLFHGSNTVFIAPISGAIFAILLYLLFTSGTLKGTFFPDIYTPEGNTTTSVILPITRNANTNTAVVPDVLTGTTDNSNSVVKEPAPSVKSVPNQGLNVIDFLARSGPGSGKDYAMLIVWCFIAGFAERFVPDVLDRLITNGKGGSKG